MKPAKEVTLISLKVVQYLTLLPNSLHVHARCVL